MLLARLLLLLALLALIVAAGIGIGASGSTRVTPRTASIEPAPGFQEFPDVASNGKDYFVVWEDRRRESESDIYGTRVTAAGQVLDPGGIAISTRPHSQLRPKVAWSGLNYVVVWGEEPAAPDTGDVFAARVSGNGRVLDPKPIPISTAPGGQTAGSAARNGRNTLVVWLDARGEENYRLWGSRLDPRGRMLEPNGFRIIPTITVGQPGASCVGGLCLVTWGFGDVWGTRITADRRILDPGGFRITQTALVDEDDAALASDGSAWFVAWSDFGRFERHYELYGARVARSGRVLDRPAVLLATGYWNEMSPDVAWDGSNYLVVYADDRRGTWDIRALRVTRAGKVRDRAPLLVHPGWSRQEYPAVASNGRLALAVWRGWSQSADIYGARIDRSGRILDRGDPFRGDRLLISVAPGPRPPAPPPPVVGACRVPKVIGLRLPAASARIRRARCRVGRVARRRSHRTGVVIAQSPRPASRVRPGTRVNLVVGRR